MFWVFFDGTVEIEDSILDVMCDYWMSPSANTEQYCRRPPGGGILTSWFWEALFYRKWNVFSVKVWMNKADTCDYLLIGY